MPRPCWLTVVDQSAGSTACILIASRFWRVWLKLTVAKVQLSTHRSTQHSKDSNSCRWTWLTRTPSLWKAQALVWILYGGALIALLLVEDTCGELQFYVSTVTSAACFTIVIAIAWKLRTLQDGFYIREELKYCAILFVLMMIAVSITNAFPSTPSLNISIFILNAYVNVVWFYPVAISFGRIFHPFCPWTWCSCESNPSVQICALESRVNDKQLLEVLTSDAEEFQILREEFEDHLASEFSVENLMFWCKTKAFFEQCQDLTDDEAAQLAARIYFDFIHGDSPSQVNISGTTRSKITAAMNSSITNLDQLESYRHHQSQALSEHLSPSSDPATTGADQSVTEATVHIHVEDRIPEAIFEEARAEIFRLMARDSFARWQAVRHKNILKATKRAF